MRNTGVIPEFTVNQNGVTIKKCCASCEYKTIHDTEGPKRKCTFDERNIIVDKSDLCNDWKISYFADNIKIRQMKNERRYKKKSG